MAAYSAGVPLTAGALMAQAAALAAALPPGRLLLNLAVDRLNFTIGFLAGLIAGRLTLLPSSHTAALLRRLTQLQDNPQESVLCLTDAPYPGLALPQLKLDALNVCDPGDSLWPPPQVQGERVCAQLYTSGSTGEPQPHTKRFAGLLRGVQATAQRLGLTQGRHVLVSTVPPQHMYGLEASVLLPLASGNALCAEQPFYPVDVCETLAAVPAPRVLICTPMHLRALLAADVRLPQVERVISATAPLQAEEARAVEQRFNTQLVEIYGSTETGQLAQRRSALTAAWELWPDVRLFHEQGQVWAEGGHIEQPAALSDHIEILPGGGFLLHGRVSDLVNIAGKRSSLSYLDHQLRSIPGVTDGAFFQPAPANPSPTGVTRVAAVVVAPGLSAAAVLGQLRARVDPVFLPRPLLLVERLPRTGTGKLPLAELRQLAASALIKQT